MLLKHSLETLDHQVTVSHSRGRNFIHKYLGEKNSFDVNIFLERVFPNWSSAARINLLIPNQERYPKRHLSRLKNIDYVLCKSRHAENIFKQHASTKFIGFISKDLHLNDEIPDYQRFFHLAGRSTLKGTEAILNLWQKHPEWPTLTLVQHKHNAPDQVPNNVNLITDYLPYNELIKLCNKCGVHLCPSLSEGWGHYIVEAMSCKALVVTTDAPPMNELIHPDRGMLVPFQKLEPRHLGTNFFVDEQKLESHIEHILKMSGEEKESYGQAARLWFEANLKAFETSLTTALDQIFV